MEAHIPVLFLDLNGKVDTFLSKTDFSQGCVRLREHSAFLCHQLTIWQWMSSWPAHMLQALTPSCPRSMAASSSTCPSSDTVMRRWVVCLTLLPSTGQNRNSDTWTSNFVFGFRHWGHRNPSFDRMIIWLSCFMKLSVLVELWVSFMSTNCI